MHQLAIVTCHLMASLQVQEQKQNVDEKDVQPTHVQMEQEKKESPPVGVEIDAALKEVSSTCFFCKTIVFCLCFAHKTIADSIYF